MYYLYRHIRLDKNEPFYIGIGTIHKRDISQCNPSSYYRRAYLKRGRNSFWNRIVKLNPSYEIEILMESEDYEFIKQKESEFIKMYGRINQGGNLANMNDGGEGNIGYSHSEETKKKMRKPHNVTSEGRERLKSPKPARSETHRKNLGMARKGKNVKRLKRTFNGKEELFQSASEASKRTGFRTHLIYLWVGNYQKPRDGSIWEHF